MQAILTTSALELPFDLSRFLEVVSPLLRLEHESCELKDYGCHCEPEDPISCHSCYGAAQIAPLMQELRPLGFDAWDAGSHRVAFLHTSGIVLKLPYCMEGLHLCEDEPLRRHFAPPELQRYLAPIEIIRGDFGLLLVEKRYRTPSEEEMQEREAELDEVARRLDLHDASWVNAGLDEAGNLVLFDYTYPPRDEDDEEDE